MVRVGRYSPLTAPRVAISLARFSLRAPTCLYRQADLAGASAPAPSPPLGGISRKLWERDVGKTLPSLAGFPPKTAAD